MVDKNSHLDVNATVDGDEDRGATKKDLAQEVMDTGGPVTSHSGELRDVPASGGSSPLSPDEIHDFEGSSKGANSDDQYEGQTDAEAQKGKE